MTNIYGSICNSSCFVTTNFGKILKCGQFYIKFDVIDQIIDIVHMISLWLIKAKIQKHLLQLNLLVSAVN